MTMKMAVHIQSLQAELGTITQDAQPVASPLPNVQIQKIRVAYIPKAQDEVRRFWVGFDFMHHRRDLWEAAKQSFHWIPNIKSKPGHICGQHAFRSPAVIVSVGGHAAALIPDLDEISHCTDWDRYLDLRFSERNDQAPRIEYGIQKTTPSGHVYYAAAEGSYHVDQEGMFFSFYLLDFNDCSDVEILRTVNDFIWDHFAKQYEISMLPQTVPFGRYADYGNRMALERLWQQGPGADTGGIVLSTYEQAPGIYRGREYADDIWFHTWFNNMRTAMELAAFGHAGKALSIAKCLVAAPQDRGLFPTIYAPHDGGWVASSQHGGGRDVYSLPDCAWSAIWLRKFITEHGNVDGAETFLADFGESLLRYQNESGGFPCWVTAGTFLHDARLNDTASSALPLWFLGEELLTGAVPENKRAAIERAVALGADFLIAHIIGKQKFEDYELYYSCSPKPLDFYDDITCMYGQNTLAIQWCAECLRVAHLVTGNERYLENGLYCLYLLSLYQQAWDSPYLDFYTFGGFGVMNTDGEWNDARQAQFAETLMNYYDITGDFRWIKRAVAAARASLALVVMDENKGICPQNYQDMGDGLNIRGASAENFGHGGFNHKSGISGFHWGTGSALVTAARMQSRYGDILVDSASGQAIGIDGILVKEFGTGDGASNPKRMKLSIETLGTNREMEIHIAGCV